ncbi:MAG: Tad domain-containing protein [Rhodobacteraceae bacterium]|nr:Tad domain-containing protein [Paracoccaceae bacterium]
MRPQPRIERFAQDETGAILVFAALAIGLMLILVAWTFDIGRLAATQSELQSYADQVALAAAGELDGRDNSITRATAAANALIADTQTFGSGNRSMAGAANYALSFYETLPGSDQAALLTPTTVQKKAAYVRVAATPQTVSFDFRRAFATLTGTSSSNPAVSAVAIAGFTQYACDVTPMMFCVPSSTFDASDPNTIGDMIRLRSGGQGAAWGPGNFGFLEPSTLGLDSNGNCAGTNGAGPSLECVLGAVGAITQCYAQRGVNTEPGQKVGITSDALNTRFDMWSGNLKNDMNLAKYAPAPNVIKGIEPKGGNACSWNNTRATADTLAIPRDDCFPGCAPYGDGTWSTGRTAYVTKNYGGTDPHPSATTRYQYYLAEIAAAGGLASSNPILTGRSETGRPMCAPAAHPDPERRVIIAAGIDCGANPISGSTTAVPVHQFVKMFITEPVVANGTTNGLDIYAEIIGSAGGNGGSGGSAGVIHDVVQLYR